MTVIPSQPDSETSAGLEVFVHNRRRENELESRNGCGYPTLGQVPLRVTKRFAQRRASRLLPCGVPCRPRREPPGRYLKRIPLRPDMPTRSRG